MKLKTFSLILAMLASPVAVTVPFVSGSALAAQAGGGGGAGPGGGGENQPAEGRTLAVSCAQMKAVAGNATAKERARICVHNKSFISGGHYN